MPALSFGSVLGAGPLVDPESGKSLPEMKAWYAAEYARLSQTPWGSAARYNQDLLVKDIGRRMQRLGQRMEKAERGLRLSSREKDLVGRPSIYVGGGEKLSAILRGDEVVGWMRESEYMEPQQARGSRITYGYIRRVRHYLYTLDGRNLGHWHTTNGALDAFARHLKAQAGV